MSCCSWTNLLATAPRVCPSKHTRAFKNFLPRESEHIFDFGSIRKVGQWEKKKRKGKKKAATQACGWRTPPGMVRGDLWCCEFKQDMLCTSSSTEGDARQEHSFHRSAADGTQAALRFWTWAAVLPDCALGTFLRGSEKFWSKTTAWENGR